MGRFSQILPFVTVGVIIVQDIFLFFGRFESGTEEFIRGTIVLNDESNGLYADHNNTRCENAACDKMVLAASKTEKKKEVYYRPPKNPTSHPDNFEGVWARAFDPWPKSLAIPCFEPEVVPQPQADTGLLFLKPYKTGSSTASGIDLRIARNVARRQEKNFTLCKARFDHTRAGRTFPNRDPRKSFLWTIVRDPTNRLISQFFHFEVSRHKKEPSDEVFINYIRRGIMSQDYYIVALSTEKYNHGEDNAANFINKILEDYNFVGITERMDESAVALAILLGVPIADVLYLKAKGNGGYDAGRGQGQNICTYIWPSFISEGMESFFKMDEWQDMVHWDHIFYQAANRSLDLTIDKLGREGFEQNLAKYRKAKEVAHERCLPRTTFPCSAGGKYTSPQQTDCLWKDSGCGSECLDEVATEFDLW